MCSRFKLRKEHVLQFWSMDLWSPEASPTVVAIAVRYKSSCEMCSRSKLPPKNLPQSWVMDLCSLGVMPTVVVTVVSCSRS